MNQKRINKLITGICVKLLSVIFILFSLVVKSQVNLVPNPSFEELDSSNCNGLYNKIYNLKYWDTLKAGGGGAYNYNSCFTYSTGYSVPVNSMSGAGCGSVVGSYQVPKSGKAYIYIAFFKNSAPAVSWRFYAQVPLTTSLTANKPYCVTFNASLSNRSHIAIDELSAYFDNGSIQSVAPLKEAIANPQIKSPTGVFMTDTLNWMKVQGNFIANGTESYMTIGNFRTSAATNYTTLCSLNTVSEYYIDDVSVIELNLPADAGSDKTIMLGDSTFIGRPPEIGLECTWYNGTVAIGSGAGIWVKPATTTSYVVQQDICGLIKTDTVNVIVNYVGIHENSINANWIRLFPNPSNGEFTLESAHHNIELNSVEITDISGRIIYNKIINLPKTTIQLELEAGVYIVKIKTQNGNEVVKRLIVNN